MAQLIRILIVDDSAFVRKVVREMLSRSPFLEVVGTAKTGEEALEQVVALKPDVITCDVNMPGMGGVEFVRRQMAVARVPILMLTSSAQDAAEVMEAIDAGAVDMVQKPTALATDQLFAVSEDLVEKVKAAGRAPFSALERPRKMISSAVVPKSRHVDAVVIGVSTGGPQALRRLIPQFRRDFPVPIAMVLHMPVGYTAIFAEKLNEISELEVTEARDGDAMTPGRVYLAQAGRHLQLRRTVAKTVVAALTTTPTDTPHRPAVDVLFQSAAEVYGSRLLAVVLTGMGDDGRNGAAWVKSQGGRVFTEAEESCVIYGMPRTVKEAGLSDGSYPLDTMAEEIIRHL